MCHDSILCWNERRSNIVWFYSIVTLVGYCDNDHGWLRWYVSNHRWACFWRHHDLVIQWKWRHNLGWGRFVGCVAVFCGILCVALPIPFISNAFECEYKKVQIQSKYVANTRDEDENISQGFRIRLYWWHRKHLTSTFVVNICRRFESLLRLRLCMYLFELQTGE